MLKEILFCYLGFMIGIHTVNICPCFYSCPFYVKENNCEDKQIQTEPEPEPEPEPQPEEDESSEIKGWWLFN